MIRIDNAMVLLPIILVALALLLAFASALRVTCRRRTVDRRAGFGRAAGDPYFYPFGEMPTVPRERRLVARDFRAWGIPLQSHSAAVAHRRNESGGRPASLSGTAVVLTFPGRKA